MSKTFRDSERYKAKSSRWQDDYYPEPYEALEREYSFETHQYEYTGNIVTRTTWLKKPGGPKLKRSHLNYSYYWHRYTPSWFTRMFMTKPHRRGCRLWEREAVTLPVDLLDTVDCPDYGRKPHIYYY